MRIRSIHVTRDLGLHTRCNSPIVDVEITNDIFASGGRRYEEMDICCIGIMAGDQITQIHREPNSTDISQYKARAVPYLNRHRTMYAFNREFEYFGLRAYLKLNSLRIEEIEPFKGRGWTKDRFFEELVGDRQVTEKMPPDPFHGKGALVMPNWAKGNIENILNHNVVCLLKEHYILSHREYLLRKYAHRVDAAGWYH